MTKFDYSFLKGRIVEIYGNQEKFAEKLGISRQSLSQKMTQRTQWKQKEICRAISLLSLNSTEVVSCFFTLKVE